MDNIMNRMLFGLFQLLLCGVIFGCVLSDADLGHPLFLNQVGHSHSHGIQKRQNAVFDQLRVCQIIISDEQCNNGLIQQSVDFLQQCSNRGLTAQLVVDRCRRNSDGEYCNLAV